MSHHPPHENRLTPEEAALFLGVKSSTLATWRSSGKHSLPYIKINSRVMYRQSDLDTFLLANTTQHGKEAV